MIQKQDCLDERLTLTIVSNEHDECATTVHIHASDEQVIGLGGKHGIRAADMEEAGCPITIAT